MRTPDGSPVCGSCGAVYSPPPLLVDPVDTAARAVGWRVFTGRTYGGAHLDTAMCGSCAAPNNAPPCNPPAVTIEQQGTLLKLNRPTRIAAGAGILVAAVAVLLLSAGNVGYASDHPVRRGDACQQIGAEAKDKSGDVYRCEQRDGASCPSWHAKHPKPGPWPSVSPCQCPSKSTSPSPSKSASTSPSVSVSPSKTASPKPSTTTAQPAPSTTPVAATLPVTGADNTVLWIGMAGAAMVVGGACLLIALARRARRA